MAVSEGTDTGLPTSRRAAADALRRELPLAIGGFAVAVLASGLSLMFRHDGLSALAPSAGIVTGVWLVTHPAARPVVITAMTLGLLLGALLDNLAPVQAVVTVAGHLFEAWLVGRLLHRWLGRPLQLDSLHHVIALLATILLAVIVGGSVGALLMQLFGESENYGRTWETWLRTNGLGMLTVVPAVVALSGMNQRTWIAMLRGERVPWFALTGLAAIVYVLIGIEPLRTPLLSLLVLLALAYPTMLWIAARSDPLWSYVGLLLLTLAVGWRFGRGAVLFGRSVDEAQAFIVLSSLWALTLAAVMEQQRRAARNAQRSERRMRDALAAGRGFTFDYDPRTDRMLRIDPDQVVAPFVAESGTSFFDRVLPDDRARLQQLVASLTPEQPMYETSYGSHRSDGRIVWLQERGVGEFDEHGRLVRLHGLATDVTPSREAEVALREADRKKDHFIATLAHELRNPLAPIRTAAELLGNAAAGSNEIGWARQVIQRQVRHMGALLDDLLDVARITRGKLELRRERVPLDAVVETAVEVARPLVDVREQRLVLDLPQPAPTIDVDPVRVAQVVSNLLTNAAKYSDRGGEITVSARARGPSLEIRVRDFGIGIPAASLEGVFQMFAQVQDTEHRREGGLGIGLSLVRRLVELHGGTVTAHSAGPGQGSEFVVTLPCVTSDGPGDNPAPSPRTEPAAPQGRRILLVDDNRDAADSLALLLGLDGHDVRVAYAGQPALELAHEFQPEVAIVDLGLPDVNGYDVARLLRRDAALAHIVLIALTGWGQDEHRRRAFEAGFDHHLAKPVDLAQLTVLIGGTSPT